VPHKNVEERRAYMRAYKKRNPEKFGRDHDRARHANRRAKLYGAQGRITVADVRAVKAIGRCFYCGATKSTGKYTDLGIDHVVPLHLGGANAVENLVCCCHSCNASKFRGDRPGQWSREHERCLGCETTARKHLARGLCGPCYGLRRRAAEA
jgi:5-methylcytosine-specific restriction endonuclease McrA